jgi:hypothetical protein
VSRRTIDDLPPGALETFGSVVHRALRENPRLTFDEAYAAVLEAWGLACSHPPPALDVHVWDADRQPKVFTCSICKVRIHRGAPTPAP